MSLLRRDRKRKFNGIGSTYKKKGAVLPTYESTDFISQLPHHIIHMLMDHYLPRKDAARTCVLSKTWRVINYSHPLLFFDERDFLPLCKKHSIKVKDDDDGILISRNFNYGVGNGIRILHPRLQNQANLEEQATRKECHDLFMNYIDSRIACLLQHESSPVEQFHLTVLNFNHEHDSTSLDLWLKHAFERRIQKLVLNVFTTLFDEGQKEVVYTLPSSCLVSQTLTQLMLANCNLGDAGGNLKLPQLRQIFLSNLDLEDDFIRCLIFGCPLLEVIDLSYCKKLTILPLTSLPQLERVAIRSCPDLHCLDIQSPQLQYFQYYGCVGKTCKVNLATSNIIKQMVLAKIIMTNGNWLQEKIVKCEELMLIEVSGFEDTKLSSQKLRHLTIHHCYDITKEIEIDCPNLCSLNHFANWFPSHYMNISELKKIIFEFYIEDYQQHKSLLGILKEIFGNHNPIKKLIKQLIIYSEDCKRVIILDGSIIHMAHMFHKVKVLMPKAKLTISSLDVEDLVNHFCVNKSKTSRQTLTVVSTRKRNNFSQALYNELSRSKRNVNCCKDEINKFWWCGLSNLTMSKSKYVPVVLRSCVQYKYYNISRILLEWEV